MSPRRPADGGRLRGALNELAEQDPFINVRQDDERHEVSVSLYGEVQKQVIGETLARDYGVEVDFHETTSICIERPIAAAEDARGHLVTVEGEHLRQELAAEHEPVAGDGRASARAGATGLGHRVPPRRRRQARPDAGLQDVGTPSRRSMARLRARGARRGHYGWQVTDCVVTMIDSGLRPNRHDRRRLSTRDRGGRDRALASGAGTQVCEPMADLRVELATAYASQVMRLLDPARSPRSARRRATRATRRSGADIPVANVHELQASLPGLTGGEGLVETELGGYEPVVGDPPKRRRRERRHARAPAHSVASVRKRRRPRRRSLPRNGSLVRARRTRLAAATDGRGAPAPRPGRRAVGRSGLRGRPRPSREASPAAHG